LFFTLKFGSSKKDDIDSFSITWQKYYGALRTFMQNNPINNALKKKREASNKKMLSNPDDPQSLSIHNSI